MVSRVQNNDQEKILALKLIYIKKKKYSRHKRSFFEFKWFKRALPVDHFFNVLAFELTDLNDGIGEFFKTKKPTFQVVHFGLIILGVLREHRDHPYLVGGNDQVFEPHPTVLILEKLFLFTYFEHKIVIRKDRLEFLLKTLTLLVYFG